MKRGAIYISTIYYQLTDAFFTNLVHKLMNKIELNHNV